MVQIGALCFGSELIYREDLKDAFLKNPSWSFPSAPRPPIIHLTKGDFKGPSKSTKMIFVCSEKSRQLEASHFFSTLYDGTPKEYPNGIMLLFIPLSNTIHYDNLYRQKIIFNHEQYLGEEDILAIHGLANLDTTLTLKDQQVITLRILLKSLPATQGMSRSQVFQVVETNPMGSVVLATFQQADREYVLARRSSLEQELRSVLQDGENSKMFLSELEGLWFDTMSKKKGKSWVVQTTSKQVQDRIRHTNMILSSPP
jgi:hypothetical protein